MTRIIGGSAGGRALSVPASGATRPTADRVREALFSSLESALGTLRGRTFLDVYAGSGAVGLEAASRGAAFVTLVERDRETATVIAGNARALGLRDIAVLTTSAASLGASPPREEVDVAFFDPPYDLASIELVEVLETMSRAGWFAAGSLIVVERARRDPWTWPPGFDGQRERRYGDTVLWYSGWSGPPPPVALLEKGDPTP
jgi:16S rRNA (guanine966-N2)-methyltransferase